MNDNKRFTMTQNNELFTVMDNLINKPLGCFEFPEDKFPVYCCFHRIIDLLNELADENEQLRKEKENWKSSACNNANFNSILLHELSIAEEQGYKLSNPFEELLENEGRIVK